MSHTHASDCPGGNDTAAAETRLDFKGGKKQEHLKKYIDRYMYVFISHEGIGKIIPPPLSFPATGCSHLHCISVACPNFPSLLFLFPMYFGSSCKFQRGSARCLVTAVALPSRCNYFATQLYFVQCLLFQAAGEKALFVGSSGAGEKAREQYTGGRDGGRCLCYQYLHCVLIQQP